MTQESKDRKYELTWSELFERLNTLAAGSSALDEAPYGYKLIRLLEDVAGSLYTKDDDYEEPADGEDEGFDISKLMSSIGDGFLEVTAWPTKLTAYALLGLTYVFYIAKQAQFNKFAIAGEMNTSTPYVFWGIDIGLLQ